MFVGLSLGSNLEDRRGHLTRALRRLDARVLGGMRVSSLWESAPVDVEGEQPTYLNCCATGDIDCDPERLLALCREIEIEAGRPADTHRAPRVLDIDLLFCGDETRATERLTLPHPRLHLRRFVLAPLAELAPALCPVPGMPAVEALLAALDPGQDATQLETAAEWWRRE